MPGPRVARAPCRLARPGAGRRRLASAAGAIAGFQAPFESQPDPSALTMRPLVGLAFAVAWAILIGAALARRVSRMDVAE